MKRLLRLFPLLVCAALPLHAADPDLAGGKYGKVISTKALVKVSSTCSYDSPETTQSRAWSCGPLRLPHQ